MAGGIQWGQMTPIAAPQVVGSLPVVQSNQADSLAGGLMQGLQQGSALQTAAQQRAESQQRMQQNEQMFPSQLAKSQADAQTAQAGAVDAAAHQQFPTVEAARAYAVQNQENAKKGENDYVNGLNPVDKMAYQTAKAGLQLSIAQANNMGANATKVNIENYHTGVQAIGQVYASASQGRTPEEQQQIFKMGYNSLPEAQQKIIDQQNEQLGIPKGAYHEQVGAAAMMNGTVELNNYILTHAKDASASEKNATTIALLRQKQKAGTITPVEAEKLSIMENNNKQGNAKGNPTDYAIGQADAETLKKASERDTNYKQISMATNGARQSLQASPSILLNPVANFVSAGKFSSDIQELESNLNRLTLLAKGQYNMGSQGFTDADRKFVQAINGDLGTYKGTLKELLDAADSFAVHAEQEDWLTKYNIYKKSSDQGQGFLKDNPEPSVQVLCGDGKVRSVPITKRDALLKDDKKAKVM